MGFQEQVVLHDKRGEGNEVLAALQLLLALVQGEHEHPLELLGNLGDIGAVVFNSTVGHGGPPFSVGNAARRRCRHRRSLMHARSVPQLP